MDYLSIIFSEKQLESHYMVYNRVNIYNKLCMQAQYLKLKAN
jgi:hypothetical protein